MDNYQEIIVSGAPINEIKAFLKSVTSKNTGEKYFCNNCVVTIERTWIEKMGSLHFQRTEITFLGREESVHQYMKAFRLRFLSAGG